MIADNKLRGPICFFLLSLSSWLHLTRRTHKKRIFPGGEVETGGRYPREIIHFKCHITQRATRQPEFTSSTLTSENPASLRRPSSSASSKKRKDAPPLLFTSRGTPYAPFLNVVAKNLPASSAASSAASAEAGLRMRCTSWRPSSRRGQQWRAAPAWTPSTDPVANGSEATSTRTSSGRFASGKAPAPPLLASLSMDRTPRPRKRRSASASIASE
mmetsp:Transcript_31135/g.69920  ORF Transcript_31135/g.69920 Transcript_31135/m.69920 type:complete len:215 (+) Transcript_31135:91-735(+)